LACRTGPSATLDWICGGGAVGGAGVHVSGGGGRVVLQSGGN